MSRDNQQWNWLSPWAEAIYVSTWACCVSGRGVIGVIGAIASARV
jgi:hypothetical protein